MKAFVIAVIVAVGLAVGAWYLLEQNFQQTAAAAFTTSGARL